MKKKLPWDETGGWIFGPRGHAWMNRTRTCSHPLFNFKDTDVLHCYADGEVIHSRDCEWCKNWPEDILREIREDEEMEMREYGVTWNPDLTF